MIGKRTIIKFLNRTSALLATIAISCGITFFVVSQMDDSQIEELEQQLQVMKKKEFQARVTKRVSEQMEGIAYQQTLISNKERDRAEEQRKIADIEKGKAEVEKGLALKAQERALESASEAEQARREAEKQSAIATRLMEVAQQNQKIAEDARAHADTLMFYSLANSLAQSSAAERDQDRLRLLAYSSWYFSEKYHSARANNGNILYALIRASNTNFSYNFSMKGNIRRLYHLGNDVIAVTDYGEALYCRSAGDKSVVNEYVRVGDYDFRDFLTEGKSDNTVLCVDGKILSIDMTNIATAKTGKDLKVVQRVQLPHDLWYRLISMDDGNTLVAMGNKTVAWIDAKTFNVIATKTFDKKLTTIGMQDDCLHIFGLECHYVSKKPGVVAPLDLTTMSETVTSYLYDELREYHILGCNSGKIFIYDNNGNQITELVTHSAAITDLHIWGLILGSTSNDNTIGLWNIADLSSAITPLRFSVNRPLCFDVNKTTEKVYIAEGNSIREFCSSAPYNAQIVKQLLLRDFTDYEWNHYIGNDIERVKFVK